MEKNIIQFDLDGSPVYVEVEDQRGRFCLSGQRSDFQGFIEMEK
jgi:hypothetical protein